ncbi:MAG: CYTH domain-containing protein [Anaerolineae bacterium]|jgi:inorganic triphosphatase YgiF
MEIEAKFAVPDDTTFQRLLARESIGMFRLDPPSAIEVRDRYFDTNDGDLYAAGYACRLRREGDRYLAGIKGLGDASGAMHRREERETELTGPLPPSAWPAGPERTLVNSLSQEKPIVLLFEIIQERRRRQAYAGDQPVAELSFDRVQVRLRRSIADEYLEIEAELSSPGAQGQLDRLVATLKEGWGLKPQVQSKFERALLVRDRSATWTRR